MDYQLQLDRGLVVTRFFGYVGDADLMDHSRRLREDPAFDSSFDQMVDTREVETVEVTNEGLRKLADVTPFGAESRRAIVAVKDVVFGVSRLFEMASEADDDHFRVFRTLDEAREWLGLDSDIDSGLD